MRDPHVVALKYRFESNDALIFDNAPPLERETDEFRMKLKDGLTRFEMKTHYADVPSARAVLERYLRTWEVDAGLIFDCDAIKFRFIEPEIVDRSPDPDQPPVSVVTVTVTVPVETTVTRIVKPRYPEPPAGFVASPDVETMWTRFQGYRYGREPLSSMGYVCLTVLEASAGGRKQAASRYGIDVQVLRKLGYLTSEIGDPKSMRKATSGNTVRAHTPAEVAWVDAVIRRLIRRVGEWAFDPKGVRPTLTMADFPHLP